MARRQLRFRRRRTSNRVLALSAIFFILALTIAPPVKHYFTQRAQISALKAELSADNTALQKAREELLLWQDPEYIKSQARERLSAFGDRLITSHAVFDSITDSKLEPKPVEETKEQQVQPKQDDPSNPLNLPTLNNCDNCAIFEDYYKP